MPTLQSIAIQKKSPKETEAKSSKKAVVTKGKNSQVKQPESVSTFEMIENKVKNEETKKKNFEKQAQVKI